MSLLFSAVLMLILLSEQADKHRHGHPAVQQSKNVDRPMSEQGSRPCLPHSKCLHGKLLIQAVQGTVLNSAGVPTAIDFTF